jgi:tRNA dimethylallyltransferase
VPIHDRLPRNGYGTGKDYEDYIVENVIIPYHLIDIVNAGYAYNLYEYTRRFWSCLSEISHEGCNLLYVEERVYM